MNDKKIIEKIYRELDGELNASEKAGLEEYLLAHPSLQAFFGQWKEVKKQFEVEQNTVIEPDLKAEILRRIKKEKYVSQPVRREPKIVLDFWQRPVFRLGLAFVAGVLVCFIFLSFLKTDFGTFSGKSDHLKGTLYRNTESSKMKVADGLKYNSSQVKASCYVSYSDSIIEMSITLSSFDQVNSRIEFNPDNFKVIRLQDVEMNNQSTATFAPNYVQINNKGDNKLILQLYNKNSLKHPIAFKIFQNASPLYQGVVFVNK